MPHNLFSSLLHFLACCPPTMPSLPPPLSNYTFNFPPYTLALLSPRLTSPSLHFICPYMPHSYPTICINLYNFTFTIPSLCTLLQLCVPSRTISMACLPTLFPSISQPFLPYPSTLPPLHSSPLFPFLNLAEPTSPQSTSTLSTLFTSSTSSPSSTWVQNC